MAALLFAALLLASCAAAPGPGVRELSVHRYAFGLFGGREIDVRDLCGARELERVEVTRRFGAWAASIGTFGVYLPHQVRISCRER